MNGFKNVLLVKEEFCVFFECSSERTYNLSRIQILGKTARLHHLKTHPIFIKITFPNRLSCEISEELNHLVETQHQQKLLLDFMKVKFLSSSALGILVTLRKKVDANKGDLVICGMNPELRKVFKITNLEKLFKFADDEPSAMALLGATTAG